VKVKFNDEVKFTPRDLISGEQGISGYMTYPFCVFSVLLFGREAPTYCYVANSYILARLETGDFG
jgi:hypothetical protein